jgi:integrase/recombinase XerC
MLTLLRKKSRSGAKAILIASIFQYRPTFMPPWLDGLATAVLPKEPLFINLTRDQIHTRLTGAGVYAIIRDQLGRKAGILTRPHGLRHTAITAALDTFKGDYRKARAFSRHTSIETVQRYDDNRVDHAGQIAQVLDGLAR